MKTSSGGLRERLRGRSRRQLWFGFVLPALALIAVSFAIAWRYVDPAPPRKVVMSTGTPGGGYDAIGQAYRVLLARDGIDLELRPSSGAVENLQRLLAPDSGVDVALVQGGSIADEPARQSLYTLGSMTVEGVWILAAQRLGPVTQLGQLRGRRIAVGPEGSGNRRLAMSLLAAEGVGTDNATLLPIDTARVGQSFRDGRIDAAVVIAGVEAPALRDLLALTEVRVARLDHVDALASQLPSLHTVRLPRGVFDLAQDRPSSDLTVVATTANLVVRDTLHPAIVDLLLAAASQVHGSRSMLARAGEFPAPRDAELPLHSQAQRYYRSGRPFLQKYLPFWIATWLDRMVVLLVPLLAVALPLVRLAPAALQWRIKRRVFRYYGDLSRLELRLDEATDSDQFAAIAGDLDALDRRIAALPVHWYYGDLVYGLRSHMGVVRARANRG